VRKYDAALAADRNAARPSQPNAGDVVDERVGEHRDLTGGNRKTTDPATVSEERVADNETSRAVGCERTHLYESSDSGDGAGGELELAQPPRLFAYEEVAHSIESQAIRPVEAGGGSLTICASWHSRRPGQRRGF